MKKKEIITLLAIIILAVVLRFYRLGTTPPSLYWDEASLGYNAYSILTTGRDEHGEFLPIARFIAFGDYKPPGYIYATVPSIALFGLNEFAVRFPSALAGTLTVLVTYFLVKELFTINKTIKQFNNIAIAALAALLLAISPWHIQFSRAAFEANLATFLSIAGVYLFMKGMKNGKFLVLSFILFAFSMYTFNTHRIFVPLLVLGLAAIYRSQLFAQKRWTVVAIVLGIALVVPQIPFLLSREGRLRFEEVTIFKNLDPVVTANERIARDNNAWWSRILHNRRVQFSLEFAKHYADHFRADFLFVSGDSNPRLGTRDQGVLYPIELPLILAGIYFLIRKKHPAAIILFFWWLVGVIPAATARETPHALRTLNVLPVPQIIASVGAIALYQIVKKKRLYLIVLSISYVLFATSYLHTYFVHYPDKWAGSWQYGYKQMINRVSQMQGDYDQVFITNKYGRPYIYLLFYQGFDPRLFWTTRVAQRDWYGFWTVESFDRYRFGGIPDKSSSQNQKWLIVAAPTELPKEAKRLELVYFPDGEVAFEIGELR